MKQNQLRLWELSALLTLCVLLCGAVWAQGHSSALSGKMVRLHVLAVSDSPEEQALKLRVRDGILAYLAPKLTDMGSQEDVLALLREELANIRSAAGEQAEGRPVQVSLSEEFYPTREYGRFRLPAGRYQSLRVVLGEGKGHNWWCVVFPPVCLAGAEGAELPLDEEELALLATDAEESYAVRFRLLELWGELRERLASFTSA